jgi:hypothetical protein
VAFPHQPVADFCLVFALTKIGILSILFANMGCPVAETADYCAPFPC